MKLLYRFKQAAGLMALSLLWLRAMVPGSSLEQDLGGGALLAVAFWLVLQVGGLVVAFFRPAPLPARPRQAHLLVAPSTLRQSRSALLAWGFPMFVLWATTRSETDGFVFLVLLSASLAIPMVYSLVAPGPALQRHLFGLQLASLIEAEVPLPTALELFCQDASRQLSTRFTPYPTVLHWLAFDLRCGSLLSTALARHAFFPKIWVSLVRMGEQSQTLPQSLRALSRIESGTSQRSHLLRPLLLLPAVLMIHAFLQWVGIGLVPMLTDQGTIPQWMAICQHRNLFVWAILLVVVSVFLYQTGRAPRRLLAGLQNRMQHLPWLWPLVRLEQQWTGFQSLHAGARAGLSLEEMVRMARDSSPQRDYQQAFDPRMVSSGSNLEQLLRHNERLFEPEVISLVAFGEQAQHLEEALCDCCHIIEQRLLEQHSDSQKQLVFCLQVLAGVVVALNAIYYILPSYFYSLDILSQGALP